MSGSRFSPWSVDVDTDTSFVSVAPSGTSTRTRAVTTIAGASPGVSGVLSEQSTLVPSSVHDQGAGASIVLTTSPRAGRR